MKPILKTIWTIGSRFILSGFVLFIGGSAAFIGKRYTEGAISTTKLAPVTNKAESIHRSNNEGIIVPVDVATLMGLKIVVVTDSNRPASLPSFHGNLAFDNDSLCRCRSRFAGELVELGQTETKRPLQVGDQVKAGQLLAVVWSKDLGEKKSELVEAISKMKTDSETLRQLRELRDTGGVPERSVRDAERTVQADGIVVDRAERTLRSWRLSDDEMTAIRTEADRLQNKDGKRDGANEWAKVEIRATQAGTIVEKNVNPGDLIDTSSVAFVIGNLGRLAVWVHVYEEDLRLLPAFPIPTTVTLPSRPGHSVQGTLEKIGPVIDPNQHTALAQGWVENPNGMFKVGQTVAVAISLPPTSGEIELPVEAVVEDGRESVVFVQRSETESEYLRKAVSVTRRFRDVIYVRAEPDGIRSGVRVVTAGSLLLRDAVEQLPIATSNGQ